MINHILPLIPPHRIYVEPFFGGGSIFFAKGPSFLEVINDINDNVVNFYQVMQNDFDSLLKEVNGSLMAESLHKKATRIYRKPNGHSKVTQAWAFWYAANFSIGNNITKGWKTDNGTDGSHYGVVVKNRRNEFETYRDRLSSVQISKRDALKVIPYRDYVDTFFYLDPPYPGADQGHYGGYTESDLAKLLDLLQGVKGRFMLSNYPSELIDTYADLNGWQVKEFDMRLSVSMKPNQRKREVLVMNYEPENKLF